MHHSYLVITEIHFCIVVNIFSIDLFNFKTAGKLIHKSASRLSVHNKETYVNHCPYNWVSPAACGVHCQCQNNARAAEMVFILEETSTSTMDRKCGVMEEGKS